MADSRKISSSLPSSRGAARSAEAAPAYIHPVIRRFWSFTREMAKKFSGNLLKDRSEELIKSVNDHFGRGI